MMGKNLIPGPTVRAWTTYRESVWSLAEHVQTFSFVPRPTPPRAPGRRTHQPNQTDWWIRSIHGWYAFSLNASLTAASTWLLSSYRSIMKATTIWRRQRGLTSKLLVRQLLGDWRQLSRKLSGLIQPLQGAATYVSLTLSAFLQLNWPKYPLYRGSWNSLVRS